MTDEPKANALAGDLAPYISFVSALAKRLETELADEIKDSLESGDIDDPDDPTEMVWILLSIGNWRTAISNLRVIAGLLDALEGRPR